MMRSLKRICAFLLISARSASAAYKLVDNYNATNFFDLFEFFSDPDPTQGFVNYHSAETANTLSLAGYASSSQTTLSSSTSPETIYMGVDYLTHTPSLPGRSSVRVHSKKTYTRGLFIADIKHMPASTCGVWPAFWTFGDNWPNQGEIDILEGVNDQNSNKITLHTKAGCQMDPTGSLASSKLVTTDCNADEGFQGCGFSTVNVQSYGSGFNAIGGGVYAMEWTSSVIRVFFFPRSAIPKDITSSSTTPDPTTWGTPVASFSGSGGCDIDGYFQNHQIVFDTTFCGQWAGKVWEDGTCGSLAKTCVDYVSANPEAFAEAFWEINSVKVFQ